MVNRWRGDLTLRCIVNTIDLPLLYFAVTYTKWICMGLGVSSRHYHFVSSIWNYLLSSCSALIYSFSCKLSLKCFNGHWDGLSYFLVTEAVSSEKKFMEKDKAEMKKVCGIIQISTGSFETVRYFDLCKNEPHLLTGFLKEHCRLIKSLMRLWESVTDKWESVTDKCEFWRELKQAFIHLNMD